MSADLYKRQAAEAALPLVQHGQTLGLGTGSTIAHLIDLLGEKVRSGLSISAVPTSEDTRNKALAEGIEIIEPDEASVIDLVIDGADETTPDRQLIKGGGGALLREKIVANAGQKFIVIADVSKKVSELGAFPLPVEIDRALWSLTVRAIRDVLSAQGFAGVQLDLRGGANGSPAFITDGGNYIIDCALQRIGDPKALERALSDIPGVVETGLFIDMAHEVILAGPDGIDHF